MIQFPFQRPPDLSVGFAAACRWGCEKGDLLLYSIGYFGNIDSMLGKLRLESQFLVFGETVGCTSINVYGTVLARRLRRTDTDVQQWQHCFVQQQINYQLDYFRRHDSCELTDVLLGGGREV